MKGKKERKEGREREREKRGETQEGREEKRKKLTTARLWWGNAER